MRRTSLTLLVLFSLGLLGALRLGLGRRPDVPLDRLLFNGADFPSQWQYGQSTIKVDWEIKRESSSYSYDRFRSNNNLGRVWASAKDPVYDPASTPRIVEYMFYFDSPAKAAVQYFLSRPEFVYRDDWPNFDRAGYRKNRYPSSLTYESPHADQEHLVCAMGSPEACQLWIYWARYGQYILDVALFAPNEGMSEQVFSEIVTQMDEHIGRQLVSR